MTALIFGANGQDGQYLTELLTKQGLEVIGVTRGSMQVDITDYNSVKRFISNYKPGYIFHLAANSTTKNEALFENHEVITTGTLNVLESVRGQSPDSKVFISGSGLQFRNEGKPIKETDPFDTTSAYAVSRIQSVYAARYFRSLGVKVYTGYFFNHDSPLRTARHMTRKISQAAMDIKAGKMDKLEIGDMSVIKEYGFAGDIVKGIWTLVNQEQIMEANIATGKGYSIADWAKLCFSLVGLNYKDHIISNNGFVAEYRQLVSDPALIFSLGWKPETSFDQLAGMMMAS